MLTITIGPKKWVVTTADNRRVKIFPAFVEQHGEIVRLNDYTKTDEIDRVEILLPKENKTSLAMRRVNLSQEQEGGIIRFLNRFQWTQDTSFDCYAFTSMLHGLPQHAKPLALVYWNLEPVRSLPKVGQAIFLMSSFDDENMIFAHAALYIGCDMFISVYGAGGQLEFSTLRDMVHDFRAIEILLATPRT